MWTTKSLKEKAKKILSKNYWKAFLVTLVLITVTGAGTSAYSGISSNIGSSFGRSVGKSRSNTKITSTDNSSDKKSINGDINVGIDGKEGKISVKIEDGKITVNGKEIAGDNGEVKININGKNYEVSNKDGKVTVDGKDFNIGDASGSVDFEDGKIVVKDKDKKVIFSGDADQGKEAVIAAMGIFAVLFAAVMFIICVFGTLLDIFVINPVRVGGYNYFNNLHEGTSKFTNIFGGFTHGHYKASIRNMFLRDLYVFLWSLLFVIPGIIKSYSYWMVPYITAANPNLSASRAFEISKKTMSGEKWHTFVLQLSFIGWDLLALLTFGVGSYFLAPYKETTYVELYATLKEKAIASGIATEEELAIAA